MNTKNLFDLQIDADGAGFLSEIAKWGKFLAILGFISSGFCILGALGANFIASPADMEAMASEAYGASPSAYRTAVLIVTYFVLGVIFLFPYIYLYRFATRMQRALQLTDQELLNSALSNLKSSFKFVGIVTIIGLAFVVLAVIFAVIAFTMATQQ